MRLKKFNCNAGRDFINVSIDLWDDFKNFYNGYVPNEHYEIVYKNLDNLKFQLEGTNVINDFLQGQLEVIRMLLSKDEGFDVHDRLIILKQSISEFSMIKHLISGSDHPIVLGYLDFIGNKILPLYSIKNDLYEAELNIKHHRSFVRKSPEEFGYVKLSLSNTESNHLLVIKKYFRSVIPIEDHRVKFEQEFIHGRVNDDIYDIDIKELKKFCDFFKFLIGSGYLIVEKKALAKWLNRKFRKFGSGKKIGTAETLKKYLNGDFDIRFLNKLNL